MRALWKFIQICGALFLGLVVLVIFFGSDHKAHPGAAPAVASNDSSSATPPIPLPRDEQDFLDVVERFSSDYQAAANDMAKGVLRAQRARALCVHPPTATGSPWVGTVTSLSSNNSGKGVLAIQLAEGITVSTTNNELSDSIDNMKTLIDPGSAVSAAAAALRVDQPVFFTGRFEGDEKDCVRVNDITQDGAMTEPEFLFQFSSVRAAAP